MTTAGPKPPATFAALAECMDSVLGAQDAVEHVAVGSSRSKGQPGLEEPGLILRVYHAPGADEAIVAAICAALETHFDMAGVKLQVCEWSRPTPIKPSARRSWRCWR